MLMASLIRYGESSQSLHADCDLLSTDGLPHQVWRVLRTGGVYILISSLESTELALGPPAWRQGEWHVSKSRVETGMGRRCFVFRAIKRQGTTDASLHADCD
jgi:hypothetical protein